MRFTGNLHRLRAQPTGGSRLILPLLADFALRIRQRRALVTRLSCFLSLFGGSPIDRAAAPGSGPRLPPYARPRPWRGRQTTEFPESGPPQNSAGGYIAGIRVTRRKSSLPPRIRPFPSPPPAAG